MIEHRDTSRAPRTARWLACGLAAGIVVPALAQPVDLKPFPPPTAGQQRFVIRVPAGVDEDARRVQVLVGKTVEVDCNRTLFGASVEKRTAQGWGFDYYVVGPFSQAASTLMACPPGEPKRREFVAAPTPELESLRYNPRLPLVVYAPAGAEVRYRIWSAGDTVGTARVE